MNKTELRQIYRGIRNEISEAERKNASQLAAAHLFRHPLFQQSEHIACYLPVKNEMATAEIIKNICDINKHCYLPVLTQASEPLLLFVRYQLQDNLQANRYGILEPLDFSETIPAEQLHLVLVPLIAFDLQGNRLGTGGGYYDRAFAFLKELSQHKPQLLGLAYAKQQAPSLPSDSWDIRLDGVVTERGVVGFSKI